MKLFWRRDRNAWYVRYKDERGKWRAKRAGGTEAEAHVVMERLREELLLLKRGRITRAELRAAEQAERPIGEVVEEYRRHMEGRQLTRPHIKEALRCIRAVVAGIGAKCLGDVEAVKVERWLEGLIRKGRSACTRNVYLRRMNGLVNWAYKRGYLREHPLRVIDGVPEERDRREVSRALTSDEVRRLLKAVPEKRRLYYAVAVYLGLRWSEVYRLRWDDVDLQAGKVYLRAEATKAGRADTLDIPPRLVRMLRYSRNANGHGAIFLSKPIQRTWKRDLELAGIRYEVNGQQADRKCLRKTCCTQMILAGGSLWQVVRHMRHRDPKVTLRAYAELGVLLA